MLSFVLANGLHVLDKHLKPPEANQPTNLDTGYDGLEPALRAQVQFAVNISADGDCQNVVRGALALYGMDQVNQARKLLAVISSKGNFTKALITIIREHFSDPKWDPCPF
jgi:hypothetical protein